MFSFRAGQTAFSGGAARGRWLGWRRKSYRLFGRAAAGIVVLFPYMAILIEAINVVVKLDVLRTRYPGGIAAYEQDCPNRSFCADNHLARVGFLNAEEMEAFVARLDELGLCPLLDGCSADIAIVDQVVGPTAPCPWLSWGKHIDGFSLAWLEGTDPGPVVVPLGWTLADSQRVQADQPHPEAQAEGLEFVRHDEELDVYRDPRTGREVYLSRSATNQPPAANDGPALAELDAIADRAFELEENLDQARGRNDAQAEEAMLAELANDLLPRAEQLTRHIDSKARGYYVRGVVLRVAGRLDEALAAYERSLTLEPDVPATLLEITCCLGQADRSLEAEPYALRATEIEPQSAAAWGNLALTYIHSDKRPEARGALNQALALDPDDPKNMAMDEQFEELFE
jgi:Tetratricopeptide repeat